MDENIVRARQLVEKIISNIEQVIVGKHSVIELAVIALLSEGHLLIEDSPGMGKTMLARALARSVNCTFKRIQFTPDMLPGDVTGVFIYNQKTGDFEFRSGPIMAQIVLADEINRAAPKVQSALLEPMEEFQVTVEGHTYKMPKPFHVFATQDPIEFEGIFPLPEAQLDRFLLHISLGYPGPADEVLIMERQQYSRPIEQLSSVAEAGDLLELQRTVKQVFVDDLIKQYIVSLIDETRHHPGIYLGVSPRGTLALFRTCQARALMQGRDYVLPDDVKALAVPVLAHRIIVSSAALSPGNESRSDLISGLLEKLPVPGTVLKK